jgi:thiol-disulfide isomerase/thioredoxin
MKATFALVPALLLALSISAFSQNIESITTPLTTPGGEQTSIAQIGKGKPTVVSFWATWCKPCKEEMKAMGPIYERLKGKIAYVAVSIDNTKTMAKVGPFIESKGYTFPVLLDPNSEVFLMLNGTNVPYTVIFNADGTLHSKHDGYLEGDEVKLEEELVGMIPTNTPAGQ